MGYSGPDTLKCSLIKSNALPGLRAADLVYWSSKWRNGDGGVLGWRVNVKMEIVSGERMVCRDGDSVWG